jgi:hypothetical protein
LLITFRKVLNVHSNDLKYRLADSDQKAKESFKRQDQILAQAQLQLDKNNQLILAGNNTATKLVERIEWIQKLGSDLKKILWYIVAGNLAIYRELKSLRSAFVVQVDRPLVEDPFILEDAVGRFAPVHLRFINSWPAFDAVMEIRFQGKQGLAKIRKREYVLQESANGKEIDRSIQFEDAFLPGQKVTMSILFKKEVGEQSIPPSVHCPRCGAVAGRPENIDILWWVAVPLINHKLSSLLNAR